MKIVPYKVGVDIEGPWFCKTPCSVKKGVMVGSAYCTSFDERFGGCEFRGGKVDGEKAVYCRHKGE